MTVAQAILERCLDGSVLQEAAESIWKGTWMVWLESGLFKSSKTKWPLSGTAEDVWVVRGFASEMVKQCSYCILSSGGRAKLSFWSTMRTCSRQGCGMMGFLAGRLKDRWSLTACWQTLEKWPCLWQKLHVCPWAGHMSRGCWVLLPQKKQDLMVGLLGGRWEFLAGVVDVALKYSKAVVRHRWNRRTVFADKQFDVETGGWFRPVLTRCYAPCEGDKMSMMNTLFYCLRNQSRVHPGTRNYARIKCE